MVPVRTVWRRRLADAYPISVTMFTRMVDQGILRPDDRVELIHGLLVKKMSMNSPHRIAKRKLFFALNQVVPPGYFVDEQAPVRTTDSVVEPDVMVLRGNPDDYFPEHALASQTSLLIEVADTSLADDRSKKKALYANEGVTNYWIVNLADLQIEAYTDPTGPSDTPTYRSRIDYRPGSSIPVVLDGREVGNFKVEDAFPKPNE